MTRDPSTLILIIMLPLTQITLYGLAINVFPKHLPTAVISYDNSPETRRFIQALSTSAYFNIISLPKTEAEADQLMRRGKANFILTIPPKFTQDLIRGNHPHMLLQVDGSVPGGTGGAIQAAQNLSQSVFDRSLQGPLHYLNSAPRAPFILDTQTKYNPDLISINAVLPGLIGTILTFSLVILSSVTITEEKESGTIEALLNSPIQPLEILAGKFLSYLLLGYILLIILLFITMKLLFHIRLEGNLFTLLVAAFPFIAANLIVGLAASSASKNALQAQQFTGLFTLPSVLLSGFMFPFYGMPGWAQSLGNALPLTHYIRMSSGIMMKGYEWNDLLPDLYPILLFSILMILIALFTFRKTVG